MAELSRTPAIAPAVLARRLGTSYATLRRRFHAATGRSIRDEQLHRRLADAKNLLHDGTRRIADIAAAVGYADAAAFTRAYHRRYGHAPTRR